MSRRPKPVVSGAADGQSADSSGSLRLPLLSSRPALLEFPGIGPISAAQVLVSWSHAGRLRSDAAFAALAGANPIPASSGQVIRHRLNRSSDLSGAQTRTRAVGCQFAPAAAR